MFFRCSLYEAESDFNTTQSRLSSSCGYNPPTLSALHFFDMNKAIIQKKLLLAMLLVLACGLSAVNAQPKPSNDSLRLVELQRLRNELKANDSFRNADAVVILGERAIADAAKQFIGLEITLANGNQVQVNSIETSLTTGAALIKLGLQYKSVKLMLFGRMASGEIKDGLMRMPIRVTEVKLQNGGISGLLVKTMFGEWLKPETWNDELPSLDLPLQLNEAMEIPPSQFSLAPSGEGQIPMDISTPAYRAPLRMTLTSLLMLDKRALLALQINPAASVDNSNVGGDGSNGGDAAALESEIIRLSSGLIGAGDVRLRISRNLISSLLSQIAAQQNPDLNFKLKQGRVRANEIKAVVSILNYTDIENGDGQADVSELRIESIADGNVNVRLSGQGVIDARVKGREFGVPYGLSPRTNFAIIDQLIPLQFVSENGKVIFRASPGSALPINVRFSLDVAGREVGINRTEIVQADRWLSRVELPSLLNREIMIPRKMEIDAGGNMYVTNRQKLNYSLMNLRVAAANDALDVIADIKLDLR